MYLSLALIYFVLLITLGTLTLRKHHTALFVIGIFLPLFWLIGALMAPAPMPAKAPDRSVKAQRARTSRSNQ